MNPPSSAAAECMLYAPRASPLRAAGPVRGGLQSGILFDHKAKTLKPKQLITLLNQVSDKRGEAYFVETMAQQLTDPRRAFGG